jgi:hypothetical protein
MSIKERHTPSVEGKGEVAKAFFHEGETVSGVIFNSEPIKSRHVEFLDCGSSVR